jgi:hypothetical protein
MDTRVGRLQLQQTDPSEHNHRDASENQTPRRGMDGELIASLAV